MVQQTKKVFGFVGAGSMAEALLHGIIHRQLTPVDHIWLTNRNNRQRLQSLHQHWGVQITESYEELCRHANIIVLAVKPIDMARAVAAIRDYVQPGSLVISVAAGVTTEQIETLLPGQFAVVRAMPNTSSMVLAGATAMSGGRYAKERDLAIAEQLFDSVGCVVRVPEHLLDAVTSVSGSGPAYVYLLIEAMVDAAKEQGLSEDIAAELVVQTVAGAAKMIQETGLEPKELRRRVTSPGGTTMAAIEVLERGGFSQLMNEAIHRAASRARELAEESARRAADTDLFTEKAAGDEL